MDTFDSDHPLIRSLLSCSLYLPRKYAIAFLNNHKYTRFIEFLSLFTIRYAISSYGNRESNAKTAKNNFLCIMTC